jgi:hypothetical protein
MTSVYPLPHDELVDRVRELATELGDWPSQRKVMRTCRVGSPRADAALAELRESGFDPAPAPVLTVVPDAPEAQAEPTGERTEQHQHSDAEGALDAPVEAVSAPAQIDGDGLASGAVGAAEGTSRGRVPRWPLLVIALGAFVSIWSGWVGLGRMAGFGPVQLLPGIADDWTINSAITLPLGVEAYAAFAMWTWLAPPDAQVSARARRFACWSSIAALGLGVFGQAVYHLLVTAGVTTAPWPVVVFVSCLPVLILGAGAALAHLIHRTEEESR